MLLSLLSSFVYKGGRFGKCYKWVRAKLCTLKCVYNMQLPHARYNRLPALPLLQLADNVESYMVIYASISYTYYY